MTSGAAPSLRLRERTAGTVRVSAILASLPSSALGLPAARGPVPPDRTPERHAATRLRHSGVAGIPGYRSGTILLAAGAAPGVGPPGATDDGPGGGGVPRRLAPSRQAPWTRQRQTI